MPEFKLPTIRLRGFREMTTDDIKSALAEVPRPDVKLSDIADAAIQATQRDTGDNRAWHDLAGVQRQQVRLEGDLVDDADDLLDLA